MEAVDLDCGEETSLAEWQLKFARAKLQYSAPPSASGTYKFQPGRISWARNGHQHIDNTEFDARMKLNIDRINRASLALAKTESCLPVFTSSTVPIIIDLPADEFLIGSPAMALSLPAMAAGNMRFSHV